MSLSTSTLIELCRVLRHYLGAGLSVVDVFEKQAEGGPASVRPVARRLAADLGRGTGFGDATGLLGPQFFEEFGGLSTRRLLEHAQHRLRGGLAEDEAPQPEPPAEDAGRSFISTLAAALGFAGPSPPAPAPWRWTRSGPRATATPPAPT